MEVKVRQAPRVARPRTTLGHSQKQNNPERVASLLHFYLLRIRLDKDASTVTIQLFTQCFALKKHEYVRLKIDASLS